MRSSPASDLPALQHHPPQKSVGFYRLFNSSHFPYQCTPLTYLQILPTVAQNTASVRRLNQRSNGARRLPGPGGPAPSCPRNPRWPQQGPEGILKSNLRFMQALKPFLDLLKRMLFLQDRTLLLLEIQLLGVMVYALWRIYKAVMRK